MGLSESQPVHSSCLYRIVYQSCKVLLTFDMDGTERAQPVNSSSLMMIDYHS